MKKYKNGFTMMEMLVVISIIGVLMAMLFPAIGKVRQNVKIASAKKDIQKISNVLVNYMADFGDYPPSVRPWVDPLGETAGEKSETELSENFLLCLSTKSKRGPYIDVPTKNRANTDGDYYNSSGVPEDPVDSVWDDGSTVPLYEYLDPWGNPYRYHRAQPGGASTASEGKGFDFWIVSNGPDGKPGFAKGSKDLPDGDDDDPNDGADEIDGTEDGAKILVGTVYKYSDDVVNWR